MTHFTTESDSNKTDRQTSAHPAVGWSRKVVVTVRVTTLKGFGAGRYYTYHLLSYYLDVGEPPGRWWGKAADEPWAGGRVRLGGVPCSVR